MLLDSLHLSVHAQELFPKKLQPHKIKSILDSGSERVKYHLYHHPKLMIHLNYFLTDSIYCSKCNSSYCILWKGINRFYSQFVSNQTKWLIRNIFWWIAVIEDNSYEVFKKRKKSNSILILLLVDVNIQSKIFYT